MSIKDRDWKYHDAETTRKPGYLARRMSVYRQKIKQEAEAAKLTVEKIRKIK